MNERDHQGRNKKELAEFLWLEINRAIINSSNVRNCLKILKEMDMLDFLCQHDYILDGQKLIEKLLDEPTMIENPEEGFSEREPGIDGEHMGNPQQQDMDSTKGTFSKQIIRTYGFCRN
ncbi:MAG: hypothetical protein GWM98_21700 [Nitrospinaceae bacterium]|nr:hypothetical protein [Nitrospinaceae bacterium]NIR56596.1 hypothetical protein [Nitrospinaceae bacterium]NIS87058.1 hypothetical protein [Nitrospinaceae bacterium]NIT83902.1 hypothetical protein [Nitrospinaceae bacterium]NIU46105.1 hypothetical protein [Nitrospinaceae bacterium]